MAKKRIVRKALDLAIDSLNKIKPTFSNIWGGTKDKLKETAAKPLVDNEPVEKLESSVDKAVTSLEEKLKVARDQQLPDEVKYLEKELKDIKKRLSKMKRPPPGDEKK